MERDDQEFRRAAERALARSAEIEARRVHAQIEGDQSWYVVRAVGKSDDFALDGLKRLDIETYYPQVLQMRKVPRRELSASQRRSGVEIRKPQLGPLFPRYIFARFGMARESWRDVFKIAGVGGMLCQGDLPVRVRDELIVSIKKRESDGSIKGSDTIRAVFGIGDHVVVTAGPFASFPGIVEKGIDCPVEDIDPRTRIEVAVNIFGRATPVELEVWQVAKS
jgi:transcriptional antiterminator NusG